LYTYPQNFPTNVIVYDSFKVTITASGQTPIGYTVTPTTGTGIIANVLKYSIGVTTNLDIPF